MAADWYYTTNKTQMGPVSWKELRELADVGILKPHDMVWCDGMAEWVKAINQTGLFADDGITETAGKRKKPAYTEPAKPPPARRSRRAEEEDEEDEDEDDKKSKKRRRDRDETKEKTSVGIKVGLILGGVVLVLVMLTCAGGGLLWLSSGGGNPPPPRPPIAGGNVPVVPPAPPVGGARVVSYTINNLPQNANGGNVRIENFQQGKRVIITVTNTLRHPTTDVDLYVFQGNQRNALAADVAVPQQNRNCRVEFIAPVTGPYHVRVVNLGPFSATACHVRIEEQ
jgi:hypothetical protein